MLRSGNGLKPLLFNVAALVCMLAAPTMARAACASSNAGMVTMLALPCAGSVPAADMVAADVANAACARMLSAAEAAMLAGWLAMLAVAAS